jgi:hypothetical protein
LRFVEFPRFGQGFGEVEPDVKAIFVFDRLLQD